MSLRRAVSTKLSWIPVGVLVIVAAILTATSLANAAGPTLASRTPAQLLVAMHNAKLPSAMSAEITESANLGFPAIPNIAGLSSPALSAASLLTGAHTVDVWYDGPRHVRIALPVSFGETDLRVNGRQVWLWQSHTQTATHYILPPRPNFGRHFAVPQPVRPGPRCIARLHRAELKGESGTKLFREKMAQCVRKTRAAGAKFARPLTPQQAANKLLAALGPTTKVTVAGTTTVAGRDAYVLQIAPRASQSLIDRIDIAVDAKTYIPLRLQVFGKGTASPAFQIGFTSLTLAKPAMSNFTFSPPAGAHVKTTHLPRFGLGGGIGVPGAPGVPGGRGWHATPGSHPVPQPVGPIGKAAKPKLVSPPSPAGNAGGYPNPPGLRSPTLFPLAMPGGMIPGAPIPAGLPGFPFGAGLQGTQVFGKAWLSVVAISASPAGPVVISRPGHFPPGHSSVGYVSTPPSGSGDTSAYSSTVTVHRDLGGAAGEFTALIRVLLNAATPVHGSWGSGKLLRTSLFSALITSKGTVLIGAVNPSVLYADAAKVK